MPAYTGLLRINGIAKPAGEKKFLGGQQDMVAASFNSQDPAWKGPERRIEQRRQISDRREMSRFEPDRMGRRSKSGRRSGDTNGWNNYYVKT